MINYKDFFTKLTPQNPPIYPHDWQNDLVDRHNCSNRLIRIPTGFGKTIGILGAWLWHRIYRQDNLWPRRLVWCLPMRVLVEQTEHETRNALQNLGLLWDDRSDHAGKIGVHTLMGGADAGDWHLYPEHCSILIGTQDMLLSRAMNRGYAAPRARWPMEFGLLNQDCLWVMDEVQLMDVGLATSAQLQAFRNEDKATGFNLPPCYTWWMSATLQHSWINKSPDTSEIAANLPQTVIPALYRNGHLWDDVAKPARLEAVKDAKELARMVAREHIKSGYGTAGPTLVVVNRVESAVEIFITLKNDKNLNANCTDLLLIHSRFRPAERAFWRNKFLNREACTPNTNRIIVSTQVVEAGVDISAALLITEIAPWPSLIQRFGRCARWGGHAQVIVADPNPKDDKAAAPYTKDELDAARQALNHLTDVAPLYLEVFEEKHPELLPQLYPYEPRHLLLRHELDELFDTTSDLSGADIDVSRFIRSGDERDVQVFWSEIPEKTDPQPDSRPSRDALCAVPFLKARDWLCGTETKSKKAPRLKKSIRAWVWDWLDGVWRWAERRDIYPGQTVLVSSQCGGYEPNKGWSPESKLNVVPVTTPALQADEKTDATQDDESLSIYPWQTIAIHGRETGTLVKTIAQTVAPSFADLFDLAGRWHDAGKSHPAFQNSIVSESRPARQDLAKAPKDAWLSVSRLYPMSNGERRPGFRHELASTLSLFAVLQRHAPDHPALLGQWRDLLTLAGMPPDTTVISETQPSLLEQEIISLDAIQFNLLSYLICSHHGKLRLNWNACPADQSASESQPRIRGLCDGDTLPHLVLTDKNSFLYVLPETRLNLAPATAGLNPHTGQSWTERILSLLEHYGPFTLAWLEALLRAADQRASCRSVPDELVNSEVKS